MSDTMPRNRPAEPGMDTEREWRRQVCEVVGERSRAIEQKLERYAVASLEVLVTALEARDPFMSGHSLRIAHLSASLADALGHPQDEVEAVRLAGRLHDIGMLVISDRVVNREGPLTPGEREQVRQHPVVGDQLLQPFPHLWEVGRFVRGHHERWDGSGYPDGLAGHSIPWGARILSVAETYDALVTSRSYRQEVRGPEDAARELERLSGTALDPEVVAALSSVIRQRRTLEFVVEP